MNYTQAQLSYEAQLKKNYVANVINVFFIYIIRTTTIECLLKRWQ
jgi:hypothetical protein